MHNQIKQTGKIGIFDSGLGGLTILKEVVKLMPNYEYVYLGDNLHAPYGDKPPEEIFKLTLAALEWLFDNGAKIVILACNTASANALRRIQQEVMPAKHPDKKVLGIIIPTLEEIKKFSRSGHIGILATNATLKSDVYRIEMEKQDPQIRIISQSGGNLANLIEQNKNKTELPAEIDKVICGLLSKDGLIDTVILGCTHYALIKKEIEQILPKNIRVFGQGKLVAAKLSDYLKRHDEINNNLNKSFSLSFNTTGKNKKIKRLMAYFYGEDISVSTVEI